MKKFRLNENYSPKAMQERFLERFSENNLINLSSSSSSDEELKKLADSRSQTARLHLMTYSQQQQRETEHHLLRSSENNITQKMQECILKRFTDVNLSSSSSSDEELAVADCAAMQTTPRRQLTYSQQQQRPTDQHILRPIQKEEKTPSSNKENARDAEKTKSSRHLIWDAVDVTPPPKPFYPKGFDARQLITGRVLAQKKSQDNSLGHEQQQHILRKRDYQDCRNVLQWKRAQESWNQCIKAKHRAHKQQNSKMMSLTRDIMMWDLEEKKPAKWNNEGENDVTEDMEVDEEY